MGAASHDPIPFSHGKARPMDELSERDLSAVADEDLTPEEQAELKRRLGEFVERMQLDRLAKPAPKPKRITRWDPVALTRRH